MSYSCFSGKLGLLLAGVLAGFAFILLGLFVLPSLSLLGLAALAPFFLLIGAIAVAIFAGAIILKALVGLFG